MNPVVISTPNDKEFIRIKHIAGYKYALQCSFYPFTQPHFLREFEKAFQVDRISEFKDKHEDGLMAIYFRTEKKKFTLIDEIQLLFSTYYEY